MGLAVSSTHSYALLRPIKLTLLGDGEPLSSINALVVVDPGLEEALITDAAIDELGIEVVSFKRGLLRHKGDPQGVVRSSVTP